MAESITALEAQREQLYQQLRRLGDFRRGTISVNYRRCGKPNCACVQAEHPGHGPQYLWTTTQQGKSRAQHLRLGPELEKAERELANYRQFAQLCDELVAVNEQLCRARPVTELPDRELAALKKRLRQKYSKRLKRK